MRGGAGAHVKAAITPLVTATVLPAVLRAFRKAQPEAELTFNEGLLVQALPGLIEGKIAFAIALASPQDLPYEIEFEPLAEIALPFAEDDALYGRIPRPGHPLQLGAIALRGERNTLVVPQASLERLSYNPFHAYMTARITKLLATDAASASPGDASPEN